MDVYIFNADIYCEDCALPRMAKAEADGVSPFEGDSCLYPQGPHRDGGGEADSPQHCGGCAVFLENPLTEDGMDYVQDILSDPHSMVMRGSYEVMKIWEQFYHDQLS
jgi:hypothetical protein